MCARIRHARPRLRAAGLALAALGWLACGPADDGGPVVRVVVVTLDTLRFDAFEGPAGRALMPRTRAFAERGERFRHFYAASPTTQPTHASLFTGLHPWQHGVVRNGAVLEDRFTTLAERLSDEGFETAAVVASFPLDERFGFAQGFGVYEHDFERDLGLDQWLGEAVEGRRFYALSDAVTGRALSLLESARGSRQLFWFHYFDPHDPYGDTGERVVHLHRLLRAAREGDPGLAHAVQTAHGLYAADVAHLDRALGRLWDALERDAGRVETHVIVTADHGESFGEDGSLGHGRRVTASQVHVPFFVVSPRRPAGVRDDAAGSVDLPATVLALLGLPRGSFEGRDLTAPPPSGSAAFGLRNVFAGPVEDERTDGDTVTIRGPRFFAALGGALYAGDAGEVVEGDRPGRPAPEPVAEPLRALFGRFASELDGVRAPEHLDAETREALRALGYVR